MNLDWESAGGKAGLYKVLRGGLGLGGVEGDARARLRDARLAWGLPDAVWCRPDAPCYGVALPSSSEDWIGAQSSSGTLVSCQTLSCERRFDDGAALFCLEEIYCLLPVALAQRSSSRAAKEPSR
jgi:hypothetical protein